MVNPTSASVPCPSGKIRARHPCETQQTSCSGDGAEKRRSPWQAGFRRKGRELCQERTLEVCRRSFSSIGPSIDQHTSIGKQPERIRNNGASLHSRPRRVHLPSRQTEPPQNSQRTGQDTGRVPGSVPGNS